MAKTMYEISGISKYGVSEEFYNLFIEHQKNWVAGIGSWDNEMIEALNNPEETKSKRFLNKHCRQDWELFENCNKYREHIADIETSWLKRR